MITGYEFQLTEWDRTKGLGPELLAQAKKRAILVCKENQNPDLTTNQTQFFRGIYAELASLIEALEKAGVSHGSND
jgi:hypothetical protein